MDPRTSPIAERVKRDTSKPSQYRHGVCRTRYPNRGYLHQSRISINSKITPRYILRWYFAECAGIN